jgi:pimeloyl-ACP methyl ester carboxylesterase
VRQAMEGAEVARVGQAARQERGSVEVGGERVQFELRMVDARSEAQRSRDAKAGRPAGHVLVLVPGHGQTVGGPQNLLAAAAHLSRSGIACCIDPVPARGGDRAEAEAIAAIARAQIDCLFPPAPGRPPVQATAVGWSHGGGEALRAANRDPDLFAQYLGLCPAGLVERRPAELVCTFVLEALRVLGRSLARGDGHCIAVTLRLSADLVRGLVRDLVRSRSLRRVVADVRWACRRVPGPTFGYTGEVVLLWGEGDGVVRWRDAFPECDCCPEIEAALPSFTRDNFPLASRVEVVVLPGDHLLPEVDPSSVLRAGLGLLGQLREP